MLSIAVTKKCLVAAAGRMSCICNKQGLFLNFEFGFRHDVHLNIYLNISAQTNLHLLYQEIVHLYG